MPLADTLWTAEEAARYCRVSRSMIYKLSQSGELPCLRIGSCLRFEPSTVLRYARGEIRGLPEGKVVELPGRQAA
jgi:excisionase family DNA binding protein